PPWAPAPEVCHGSRSAAAPCCTAGAPAAPPGRQRGRGRGRRNPPWAGDGSTGALVETLESMARETIRMLKTIEAVIEKDGHVRLLEEVRLSRAQRALVTILEEEMEADESALLSEAALAEDWRREEEEEA